MRMGAADSTALTVSNSPCGGEGGKGQCSRVLARFAGSEGGGGGWGGGGGGAWLRPAWPPQVPLLQETAQPDCPPTLWGVPARPPKPGCPQEGVERAPGEQASGAHHRQVGQRPRSLKDRLHGRAVHHRWLQRGHQHRHSAGCRQGRRAVGGGSRSGRSGVRSPAAACAPQPCGVGTQCAAALRFRSLPLLQHYACLPACQLGRLSLPAASLLPRLHLEFPMLPLPRMQHYARVATSPPCFRQQQAAGLRACLPALPPASPPCTASLKGGSS